MAGRQDEKSRIVGSYWSHIVLGLLGMYLNNCCQVRDLILVQLGCLLVVDSDSSSKRYALLMLAMAFSSNWRECSLLSSSIEDTDNTIDPLNGSWLALNAHSAGERSITMAMFIMAANASGIVGNQLFQAKDKPRYHTGWTVIVCLISVGVVFCAFANVQYKILNRRGGKKGAIKNDADDRLYTL